MANETIGGEQRKAIEEEIEGLVRAVFQAKEKLTEARRKLPPEPVTDYALHTSDGAAVRLSDLFGDKNDLIVIHNMGRSCPYCTLWADGFNGVAQHLANRAAFVVVSPDEPEVQAKFATDRGWKFRMASARGTTFIQDMGYLRGDDYWPGISTFRKASDGSITRVAKDYLGPGDDYCSVWHLFDLLPNGADGWEPKYRYED